ncbi:MAG: response regulator [Terriglobia bacterium]
MKKLCMLVVDDSPLIRKMVEGFLRHASVQIDVLEAANAQDALALAERRPVDLVLCDINMPETDGLALLRKMREAENTRSVPVVIMSAEGSLSRVKEAVDAGANGFLRKPFAASEMREQIIRVLAAPALKTQ